MLLLEYSRRECQNWRNNATVTKINAQFHLFLMSDVMISKNSLDKPIATRYRLTIARFIGLALAIATLQLAACSTRVITTGGEPAAASAAAPLHRPKRVLVADFTAAENEVRLDQGVGARLTRMVDGSDAATEEVRMSEEVRQAVSETLIAKLTAMGFETDRAASRPAPQAGDLVIRGQLLDIDAGNRTRRLAIGFGAGKSEVEATVEVAYYASVGAPPLLLRSYDATANSGRKPGLALGGAAGAAEGSLAPVAMSGAIGTAGEIRKSGVAGEGQRLAERIAANLGDYFAEQGWVAAGAR
jgi:hypothetical protein